MVAYYVKQLPYVNDLSAIFGPVISKQRAGDQQLISGGKQCGFFGKCNSVLIFETFD